MARSCSQQFSLPVNAPRRVRGSSCCCRSVAIRWTHDRRAGADRLSASCAVAVAGRGLQAVPVALSVPRHRPAARAVLDGAGAWFGGARRTGTAVRLARRPAGPRHRDDARRPGLGAPGGRHSPTSPTTSSPGCGPNSSMRRAHCCPATTAWKTQPGSIRRAASSASRSNSRTAPCCAASSTASMSRPPAS